MKYNVKTLQSELTVNKEIITNNIKEMQRYLVEGNWDKMIDLNNKLKKRIEMQKRILNLELDVDLDYVFDGKINIDEDYK